MDIQINNKLYEENPTQEQFTEYLLEKIKKYKNVSIKTFETENFLLKQILNNSV